MATENRNYNKTSGRKNTKVIIAVLILLVLVVSCGGFILWYLSKDSRDDAGEKRLFPAKETQTITVGSVGDVIIHDPFLRSDRYKKSDGYDFTDCFKFTADLYEKQDYMVANLETTLAGKSAGYSGYPLFNSPDAIADALHESGIDMMLLANNHIYDTGKSGFQRTAKVLDEKGYSHTGVRGDTGEAKYAVKDINGIKVGFINYTYETPASNGKAINGNKMDNASAQLLNSFKPKNLQPFYDEAIRQVALMKLAGAEFIIFYPHWGQEYKLEAHGYMNKMAQKMCDMGVDAIIGGHPHVVEPVDVVKSSDGKHKTFVAYSMGNHLSNQRREMITSMPTGHTEDGIMVNLEISRDASGEVKLTNVETVPTWVYKKKGANAVYYVIPLNDVDNIENVTGISGIKESCKASNKRTHEIIDSGMKKVKQEYGF
ncbi:MAG: CapA family protein [Bacillota bacterium]|nr:CapA family protein [Bacillota bacterium]